MREHPRHFRVAENDSPDELSIERLLPSRDIVARSVYPWLHLTVAIPPEHVQVFVKPVGAFFPVPPGLNVVSVVPSV